MNKDHTLDSVYIATAPYTRIVFEIRIPAADAVNHAPYRTLDRTVGQRIADGDELTSTFDSLRITGVESNCIELTWGLRLEKSWPFCIQEKVHGHK